MSTTAVPNNSMRQQLDELDSLLQRMLALPINQLDETPAPPAPPPPRPAAPQPQVAFVPPPPRAAAGQGWQPPAMVLLGDPGPVPQPAVATPPAVERGWSINLNPQFGSSVLAPPAPAAPPPAAMRVDAAPQAEPAFAPPQPIPEPMSRYRPRRDVPPSPLLAPLVAFNQLFDAIAGLFGPPGRWLCGPVGRGLMGTAGVLMLLGGIAWGVAEYHGWSWPGRSL
jgi:hypothetical protein